MELGRDVVILACAISAGIHGALAPAHFAESTAAGLGFAAATVLLGLIASYLLAATTGLPVLHPDPEPVDGLALATKAIEAAGLLAALELLRHGRSAATATHLQPKGTLT